MDTADTPLHDLQPTLARLRAAWQANKPDHAQRRDDLQRLRDALKRRLDEMARTIAADFGHRSLDESRIADGMTALNEIDHLLSHLRGWMKPRRVGVGWRFLPARAQVLDEVVDLVERGHAVGDAAFVQRAVAEVGGNGARHFVQPPLQRVAQALQVVAALRVVRLAGLPRITQAFQGGAQFGGRRVGDHVHTPQCSRCAG